VNDLADLVEFLLARLDDDEQTARAAAEHSREWRVHSFVDDATGRDAVLDLGDQQDMLGAGTTTGDLPDPLALGQARHIARHDPARVLAEVDTKRRILEEHEPYHSEETGGLRCWKCGPGESRYPCTTVKLLALPFVGHPDFREEWRV
jgi:hypothetical protein